MHACIAYLQSNTSFRAGMFLLDRKNAYGRNINKQKPIMRSPRVAFTCFTIQKRTARKVENVVATLWSLTTYEK